MQATENNRKRIKAACGVNGLGSVIPPTLPFFGKLANTQYLFPERSSHEGYIKHHESIFRAGNKM